MGKWQTRCSKGGREREEERRRRRGNRDLREEIRGKEKGQCALLRTGAQGKWHMAYGVGGVGFAGGVGGVALSRECCLP